jgi:hypothetical protein
LTADAVQGTGDRASEERLNYFNYFTEVEDEFVRRRGKHLLVSPIDWALVESWKDAGIPLTVVIRGISRAFDAFEARPKSSRKINSILYCEQAVEETYAEYRLAMLGGERAVDPAADDAGANRSKPRQPQTSSFTSQSLLDFLERCQAQFANAVRWLSEDDLTDGGHRPIAAPQAVSAIDRVRLRLAEIKDSIADASAIDAEAVEVDLCALDNMLFEQLKLAYGADTMQSLRDEAETQLKGYRSKMDKAMYERTLDNFVGKRLRTMCCVPRLSLFYM